MNNDNPEFNSYFENGKGESKKEDKPKKPKIAIRKYTAKGTIPLNESIVIKKESKFVYLDKDGKPQFVDKIERANDILIPADTFDTQNPIPFIFDSEEDFKQCLEQAKSETLDTIFSKFETINRKYVDTEEHYHVLLIANMIWTWFQDKFAYNHVILITGDNGSGKNSQLLVFKFGGYRVFYTVSASAPNYYTKMGNIEEGQITIAEDEAEDIARDKQKRNIIKNEYSSGGSVPKVELEGGRKSEDWLVYCQKWFVTEELPNDREMKGIIDRGFVLKFTAGEPQYNIKDVLIPKISPEFQPLHNELINIRNLLFCWRLLHYEDIIPDIKLNVKNRSAELTKPLIRLFQDSPIALGKILYSLSQFMTERNENKATSFESITYKVIEDLIEERKAELAKENPIPDLLTLGETTFTNEAIRNMCKKAMDGEDITYEQNNFWSPIEGIGKVTQTRITSTCKSRFKGKNKQIRLSEGNTRCIIFDKKALKRVKSNYDIVDEIKIENSVTLATDVTAPREVDNTIIRKIVEIPKENTHENYEIIQQDSRDTLPKTVTSGQSVTNQEELKI